MAGAGKIRAGREVDYNVLGSICQQSVEKRVMPLIDTRIYPHVAQFFKDGAAAFERPIRRISVNDVFLIDTDEIMFLQWDPEQRNVFYDAHADGDRSAVRSVFFTSPWGFAANVGHLGVLFRDTASGFYCFCGMARLPDLLYVCIDNKEFPTVFAQYLDYYYDKSGLAHSHIVGTVYWRHFAYWFQTRRDSMNVPAEFLEQCAHVTNPLANSVFWFSETAMAMHATLVTTMTIDLFWYEDPVRPQSVTSLIEKMPNASRESFYLYVKWILENFVVIHNKKHRIPIDLVSVSQYWDCGDDAFLSDLDFTTAGGAGTCLKLPLSIIPLVPPPSYYHDLKNLSLQGGTSSEPRRNPYTMAAIQVAEVVRWIIMLVFCKHQKHIEQEYMFFEKSGLPVPDFKKVSARLKQTVNLDLAVGPLRYLYDSAMLVFSLKRGNIAPILRLFCNSRIYAVPYSHAYSNGLSDIATSAAIKVARENLDSGSAAHQSMPCGSFPHCTSTELLGKIQYPYIDRGGLGLSIQGPNPENMDSPWRVECGKLIAKKTTVSGNRRERVSLDYVVRFYTPTLRHIKTSNLWASFPKTADSVIIDMNLSHMSIADVMMSITLYQTRFPFVPRTKVAMTWEPPETCVVLFPRGTKARINKYIIPWLHYTQTSPQNSVMAPLLLHNFLCALQTNDCAGMLTVAESILNLVSGTCDRVYISPRKGVVQIGPQCNPVRKGYHASRQEDEESAEYMGDNFVIHMGMLPLFIHAIDYNAAIVYPYKSLSNMASRELLRTISSSKHVPQAKPQNRDTNIPEKRRHSWPTKMGEKECILQFHPYHPTVYSAIRAFIKIAEPHLIATHSLRAIDSAFAASTDNAINYPMQSTVLLYLTTIARDKGNIVTLHDGPGGEFLVVPPYYDQELLEKVDAHPHHANRTGSRSHSSRYYIQALDDAIATSAARHVPLMLHYYPVLFIVTGNGAKKTQFCDHFYAVRLLEELLPYLYESKDSHTITSGDTIPGNYMPPTFSYRIQNVVPGRFSEVFEGVEKEWLAKAEEKGTSRAEEKGKDADGAKEAVFASAQDREQCNITATRHESFYNFLFYVETLSHFHATGTTVARAKRDIEHGLHTCLFSHSPGWKGEKTEEVVHTTFRGAVSQWNAVPQITGGLDFQKFLKYPPTSAIWNKAITKFYKNGGIRDLHFFSRLPPEYYAAAIANWATISGTLPLLKKTSKSGDALGSLETFDPPDTRMRKSIRWDLFPMLAISNLCDDPLNTANETGPFFSAHPLLPFTQVAPITCMSSAEILIMHGDTPVSFQDDDAAPAAPDSNATESEQTQLQQRQRKE